jgi:hypothetical protein
VTVPPPPSGPKRRPLHVGPIRITPFRVVLAIAFVASGGFIGWAVLRVRDTEQIPMIGSGFLVLGLAFAGLALACVRGMWDAASRASGGRAMALSILGGLAGLAAIGCLTVTALLALLWRSPIT